MRFQFWLAAESMGQDGAILPDDQPIKFQENRAGHNNVGYYIPCLINTYSMKIYVVLHFKHKNDVIMIVRQD